MYCSEVSEMAQATDGPDADVAGRLLQLTTLVQGIYACVSERHDLTPVQARLLCVLLDGPRGMAELAHCFGVEKAAVTGLMDRAESRGLARRSPVPGAGPRPPSTPRWARSLAVWSRRWPRATASASAAPWPRSSRDARRAPR